MDFKPIFLLISIFLVSCTGVQIDTNTTQNTSNETLFSPLVNISEPVEIPNLPKPTTSFDEGEKVILAKTASDPDGDQLTYTFEEPFDEDGTWQTQVGDAGIYNTTISVFDGKVTRTRTVSFEIIAINNPPVITTTNKLNVNEGDIVRLDYEVFDSDNDSTFVSISGWMTENEYQTTFEDAGEYTVTLTATDGISETTKDVRITVFDINRKPVLEVNDTYQIFVGETFTLNPLVSDADSDDLLISFGKPLDEDGSWVGEEGIFITEISVTDGKETVSKDIRIEVKTQNEPPQINISDIVVSEGETIKLEPEVSDPNNDSISLTYSGFMDFSEYETTYDDAGIYNQTIIADDGQIAVSTKIKIIILDTNRAPFFDEDAELFIR